MNRFSRRSFIKSTGDAGIAFWLGMSAKGTPEKMPDVTGAKNFTPYILVDANGSITMFQHKPEMGQGTFQSVPALIAEDFEVSLDEVTIKTQMVKKNLATSHQPVIVYLSGAITQLSEK